MVELMWEMLTVQSDIISCLFIVAEMKLVLSDLLCDSWTLELWAADTWAQTELACFLLHSLCLNICLEIYWTFSRYVIPCNSWYVFVFLGHCNRREILETKNWNSHQGIPQVENVLQEKGLLVYTVKVAYLNLISMLLLFEFWCHFC